MHDRWRAAACALISGGTALCAFRALPPQSLPGKYAVGDLNLLIPYAGVSLLAATAGILLVLAARGRPPGRPRAWRHLAVPPALTVLVPVALAVCGGNRSRWWTGLLCAAVAAGAHAALEVPRRRHRVVLCGVLAAGAVLTAAGCQRQWRQEDFAATGLPYVVADIPGYLLTGTYADAGAIVLTYRSATWPPTRLIATVSDRCNRVAVAGPHSTARNGACLGLPGGRELEVGRPFPVPGPGEAGEVPRGITVRAVPASYLAGFPLGDSLPD
jgi:hypothetical protein